MQLERIGVEPPSARLLIARQVRILSRGVRTVEAGAGDRPVDVVERGSRKSARFRDDRAELPPTENRGADAGLHEWLAVAERQLVEDRRDKPMAHVEDRQPPLAVEAETVLREQGVAIERTDATAVVLGLG